MSMWKVALLLNLSLAVGLGLGYAAWGRRLAAIDLEARTTQAQIERLERELEARDAGARAGEQRWEGRGVVRGVFPQLLLITHEEIEGLASARTTGFRPAASSGHELAQVGDPIRFWLHGTGADTIELVEIAPW